jgi:hypothetical protein
MRFEDYNSLLFEWYKDESKYDNIVKLWNSKLCISKLNDESDAQINERLKNLNISDKDNFIYEFKNIVFISIKSKSRDINNYLKRQYEDFYDLILENSIKSYHDCSVVTKNKIKEFAEKSNKINENFERHKKEIGLINLNNCEESLNKIIDISTKIINDKYELITLIDKIENEDKILNGEEKNSTYKSLTMNGLAYGVALAGTFLTGGLVAAVSGAAALYKGTYMCLNFGGLQIIENKSKFIKSILKESKEKEKEIELELKELEKKYIQILKRFIPINVA